MKTFLPLLLLAGASLHAADPIELKLWPEGAPGTMVPHSKATDDFIRTKAGKSTITDIHDPTITVYRPEKPNGTSVIVAPGGGFVFLSAVHEGTQVCEWLNTLGVTGILLKYRTPTRDEAAPHEKPVQDAAKAIALVREHAAEWKLKPDRVGLLGFSAGGNLLAHIACDRPAAKEMPNFGINIYGGGFVDPKDPTKFKAGFSVPADAPPMFMACAHDDGQNPFALTALYLEYKKHQIPAELHMFTKGGHGFGMRDNKQPISEWPQRCAEWMESSRYVWTAKVYDQAIEEVVNEMAVAKKKAMAVKDVTDEERLEKVVGQIEEARKLGQTVQVAKFQAKYDELQKLFEQSGGNHPSMMKQEIINDLERLKEELFRLFAEREKFRDSQEKAK